MRILILDTYYAPFLQDFYRRFPKVLTYSYVQNKNKLMEQLFGTADFYSRNLRLLGYEADEVILNDKILQAKWSKEHGQKRLLDWADGIHIPFTKVGFHSHWVEEILMRQIVEHKPDVLYCQNLSIPSPDFLRRIKRQTGVKVVGQVASPVNFERSNLYPFDLILTSFPHFVPRFRKLGIKSDYFRIGFEESILPKLKKFKKRHSATFVGGYTRRHDNEIVTRVATDIWGYGKVPALPKYHGEAWGIDMYNILYNSKITLNRHIDVAENHANNMRLYEATGVGTMLITDYKSDLNKLFVPGKEIETYRSQKELEDKVKYYLTHEEERKQIAKAGQRRTLKDHTCRKRMRELVRILAKYL